MSGVRDEPSRRITEADRNAAGRALSRNWPNLLPSSSQYVALAESLAEFHHIFGADKFELRYNLRPPKNRGEEWELQVIRGEMTVDEFRRRLKADAERPIDMEMLTTFCNAYQDHLANYSGVLQESVRQPYQMSASENRAQENAIEKHIEILQGKLPLWRENLETVFDFLDEMRVTSGAGLIEIGEFEGLSAHWVAQLVLTRTVEAWRSCREISERSHMDPRYLYAASARDLFAEQWLPKLPSPQSISERLREEFILARCTLRQRTVGVPERPVITEDAPASASEVETAIDNESRELQLVGEITALVGEAGHIFRPTANSDWGIDGEIEFKDRDENASGRRVYVQLKSGDSYLVQRSRDGAEVFSVKNRRHVQYWQQHAYPVMLVIRQSSGLIRWMDVSAYLKKVGATRQIIFCGELVTVQSIRQLAIRSLGHLG